MTEAFIALIALALMEIVLGIDNIVFISVATGKLPPEQQRAGRRIGLMLALGTRVLLLACIFWIAQLTAPVFSISDLLPTESFKTYFMEEQSGPGSHALAGSAENHEEAPPPELDQHAWDEFNEVSWRDIILLAGGLFLIYSSVHEIRSEVEVSGNSEVGKQAQARGSFARVVTQIAVMDIIFSLDSVITAVGMARDLWVMIAAVVIAVGVMIWFADQVGDFVEQNPTIKVLALAFLLLIGVMLVAEGIGTPISKGYIYFAMGFSLLVESANLRIRKKTDVA